MPRELRDFLTTISKRDPRFTPGSLVKLLDPKLSQQQGFNVPLTNKVTGIPVTLFNPSDPHNDYITRLMQFLSADQPDYQLWKHGLLNRKPTE